MYEGVITMSITKEFLRDIGVSEESADKIFAERGKEIQESNLKINDLNSKIASLVEENESLSSKSNNNEDLLKQIEGYKKTISEYEKEKADRATAEERAEAEKKLNADIEALFADRRFTSDYAKAGLIADIKKAKLDTPTADLSLIFETLTKGKEGIFASNSQPKVKIPRAGDTNIDKNLIDEEAKIRRIMGLPPLKN